ncbi:LysR family transcriptional regulator [Roseibium sp. MMSF_3412]|uniref:LysR family transcriptional regulator n=1 Tax=Roseibium sp. MMSF_3412 TaxID=3046712 RepID=UPI00273F2099|nr:LysR family transcriptional regulator [Roseibium sp. MMSF_3412]
MDRLQSLEVFVAVAEAESFAAGARQMNISAPSATRAVNELEERLGARLFTRTTRVVRLTDVGRTYLEEVRGILADLSSANEAVSGAVGRPKGYLRVTSPVEFGRIYVAPIVAEYLDRFPGVSASMLMVDRIVNLAEEGLDVGVRIGPLSASGLMAVKVGSVRRVVCGSPDYFKEHGVPQSPEDVTGHKIVAAATVTPSNEWRFGKAQDRVVKVYPRLSVTSVATATSLARAGWGLTRALSYQVGPDLQSGTLQAVLEDFEPEPLPVHLVHYEGRRVSVKVRSFLDLARDRLRQSTVLN